MGDFERSLFHIAPRVNLFFFNLTVPANLAGFRYEGLNAAGANPEAFHPFRSWSQDLKAGVFSFVIQVDGIRDAGHWFEADGLPVGRRINDCRRVLGSKELLDLLPASLDGKMRESVGVALKIGEARVQVLTLHRKRIRNIQGDQL